MQIVVIIAAFLLAAVAAPAFSHGGGLNAEGCHNNRKTKSYHCHRSPKPKREERKEEREESEPRPALRDRAVNRGEWNGENEWTKTFCTGDSQHVNTDGTRTDCLTNSAAVEVDFPDKWAEAHGQAIRYRRVNPSRKGEIWILCGKPRRGACDHHVPRLLADTAETGIIVRCFDWATGNAKTCPGANSAPPASSGRPAANAAAECNCKNADELRRLRRTVDVLLDRVE